MCSASIQEEVHFHNDSTMLISSSAAEIAATELYSGFNSIERHALCVLDEYLETLSNTPTESPTDLLGWTKLYKNRHVIENACKEISCEDILIEKEQNNDDSNQETTIIDNNPNHHHHIDWFRVICCFLDRQRLERAIKCLDNNALSVEQSQNESLLSTTSTTELHIKATDVPTSSELNPLEGIQTEENTLDISTSQSNIVMQRKRRRRQLQHHSIHINDENQYPLVSTTTTSTQNTHTLSNLLPPTNNPFYIFTLQALTKIWICEVTETFRDHIQHHYLLEDIPNNTLIAIYPTLNYLLSWVIDTDFICKHKDEYYNIQCSIISILEKKKKVKELQHYSISALETVSYFQRFKYLISQSIIPSRRTSATDMANDDDDDDDKPMIELDINNQEEDIYKHHYPIQNTFDEFERRMASGQVLKEGWTDEVFVKNLFNHSFDLKNFFFFSFFNGICLMLEDLLIEAWSRVRLILNHFSTISEEDALTTVRSTTAALPFLKTNKNTSISTTTTLSSSQLQNVFDELKSMLSISLPSDFQRVAELTQNKIQHAYKEWSDIQIANEKKIKEAAEAEKAKRQAATEEAHRREQHRKAAVQYIKDAMMTEKQLGITNPFLVLGFPPILASDALLNRTKKKLSLLLHPDKCLDPQLRIETQAAFTVVNEAISLAKELLSKGRHLGYLGPQKRPPFADDIGLTQQQQPTSVPFRPIPPPYPSPSTSNVTSEPSSSKDSNLILEDLHWSPTQFSRFLNGESFAKMKNLSSTNVIQPPSIEIKQKNRLIFKTEYKLRLFLTRPSFDLTADNNEVSVQCNPNSVKKNNNISFNIPKRHNMTLQQLFKLQNETLSVKLQNMSLVSLIIEPAETSFDLSNWLGNKKDILQPVVDEDCDCSFVYIAAQSYDPLQNYRCSPFVWARIPSPRLALPSAKGRLVSLIKLFDHAPSSYKCCIHVTATSGKEVTEIPAVKTLTGWTVATLSRLLMTLVTAAADAERREQSE